MNNIEIVSVHYKTPELIYNQYKTVREFYPLLPYRIIDGSDDKKMYFEDLEKEDKNFKVERFGYNIHHGPGMDHAIKTSNYGFLLILDSDVTLKKPLIEEMMAIFKGYAVGKKIILNSKGYEKGQKRWQNPKSFIYTYIHPYCMLINKVAYLQFKPFRKHGAPCIDAMIDIYNQNKTDLLSEMKIEDYVDLKIRGTRSEWGINL
jgi:GT2 family glycosyltransferase